MLEILAFGESNIYGLARPAWAPELLNPLVLFNIPSRTTLNHCEIQHIRPCAACVRPILVGIPRCFACMGDHTMLCSLARFCQTRRTHWNVPQFGLPQPRRVNVPRNVRKSSAVSLVETMSAGHGDPNAHNSKHTEVLECWKHIYASWLGQGELLKFTICLLVCQHLTIEQGVLLSPTLFG